MSWAATFNSGNSMGTDLSNKMVGIRLDSNISPAEIQAKIKKYNPELQNQNTPNIQNQAQTDTFQAQNNTQNAAPVQYNTYGNFPFVSGISDDGKLSRLSTGCIYKLSTNGRIL